MLNDYTLKPCPMCGGEAVLYHQSSKYTNHDGDYVHCLRCGCRTKLFECFNGTGKTHEDTEKEALEAWNKRTEVNNLEYTLLGVMHSVDKWLEGDELEQDEVNRAATMREKTLRIVENARAEVAREIMREVRQALLIMVLAYTMGGNYDIKKCFAEIEKKYTEGVNT